MKKITVEVDIEEYESALVKLLKDDLSSLNEYIKSILNMEDPPKYEMENLKDHIKTAAAMQELLYYYGGRDA